MNEPSHIPFRLIMCGVALLLGFHSLWILLPELYRSDVPRLPIDSAAALATRIEHDDAARAAMLGMIRGDLWAELSYTYAYLLFSVNATSADQDLAATLASSDVAIRRALVNAPHESDAWLLRGGLALRYPSLGLNALQALKMSYYTGPSETDLMRLRFRLAAQLDASGDVEIRQFMSRDLRLLVAQNQKTTVIDAYTAASPFGKRYIEQTLGDIDSSARNWLPRSDKK